MEKKTNLKLYIEVLKVCVADNYLDTLKCLCQYTGRIWPSFFRSLIDVSYLQSHANSLRALLDFLRESKEICFLKKDALEVEERNLSAILMYSNGVLPSTLNILSKRFEFTGKDNSELGLRLIRYFSNKESKKNVQTWLTIRFAL